MTKKAKGATTDLSQTIDYSQRLLDSRGWIRCADSLLFAARLLETEIRQQWSEVIVEDGQVVHTSGRQDVHGPYFLLIAFALENFFKAVRVSLERPQLRNRLIAVLPPFLNEHDLLKLASAAKLSVEATVSELSLGRPIPGADRTDRSAGGRAIFRWTLSPDCVLCTS